jgi:hypothetical protein
MSPIRSNSPTMASTSTGRRPCTARPGALSARLSARDRQRRPWRSSSSNTARPPCRPVPLHDRIDQLEQTGVDPYLDPRGHRANHPQRSFPSSRVTLTAISLSASQSRQISWRAATNSGCRASQTLHVARHRQRAVLGRKITIDRLRPDRRHVVRDVADSPCSHLIVPFGGTVVSRLWGGMQKRAVRSRIGGSCRCDGSGRVEAFYGGRNRPCLERATN